MNHEPGHVPDGWGWSDTFATLGFFGAIGLAFLAMVWWDRWGINWAGRHALKRDVRAAEIEAERQAALAPHVCPVPAPHTCPPPQVQIVDHVPSLDAGAVDIAVALGHDVHCVYRLWGADPSRALYIGVSKSALGRIGQHAASKPWWHKVQDATFEFYPNRLVAEYAEKVAIRTERPVYNVTHNPTPLPKAPSIASASSAEVPS